MAKNKAAKNPGIVAISADGDDGRFFIGAVQVDDVDTFNLEALWDEWQSEVEEPDSDSEFVVWLIETGKATEPAMPVTLEYVRG